MNSFNIARSAKALALLKMLNPIKYSRPMNEIECEAWVNAFKKSAKRVPALPNRK